MVYNTAELDGGNVLDPLLSSVRQRTEEYLKSCILPGASEEEPAPFYLVQDPPPLRSMSPKVEDQSIPPTLSKFSVFGSEPLSSQPKVIYTQKFRLPSLQSIPSARTAQLSDFQPMFGASVLSSAHRKPQLSKMHSDQSPFVSAPSRFSHHHNPPVNSI